MPETGQISAAELDHRLLILAPVGNDAAVTARLLRPHELLPLPCARMDELVNEIDRGCAGLILAEEALGERSIQKLAEKLNAQPSWSDIPVLVITSRGEPHEGAQRKLSMFGAAGNVTLLERPFRPLTIVNAARVAVRARERQYQVRDLLRERERLLEDLERRVELRTAELLETNAQLEELVYSIAHDLRAPLRAMQGFASLLLDEHGQVLPEEGRNFAERIVRSAEAMDAITLDLLSYGRIARSQIILAPVPVASAWKAAVAQCEKVIEESRAEVEAMQPLPVVQAHFPILTQVLANLLSNAIKFVPEDGQPRVSFRAEDQKAGVRLWVEDNGIGIAPQYKERIFRVFERLDGSRFQGTGIGLSIVRKGIERMGGRVGVESELGRGSRFWIELPRAVLPAA